MLPPNLFSCNFLTKSVTPRPNTSAAQLYCTTPLSVSALYSTVCLCTVPHYKELHCTALHWAALHCSFASAKHPALLPNCFPNNPVKVIFLTVPSFNAIKLVSRWNFNSPSLLQRLPKNKQAHFKIKLLIWLKQKLVVHHKASPIFVPILYVWVVAP